MELNRHFVASVYIFSNKKVLLCFHKKLKHWLPVGGHLEPNELPEEAAIREVKEETGLEIKLPIPNNRLDYDGAQELVKPRYILLEKIAPGHEHIDFIYFAQVDNPLLDPAKLKDFQLTWFSFSELDKINTFANVSYCIKQAIKSNILK